MTKAPAVETYGTETSDWQEHLRLGDAKVLGDVFGSSAAHPHIIEARCAPMLVEWIFEHDREGLRPIAAMIDQMSASDRSTDSASDRRELTMVTARLESGDVEIRDIEDLRVVVERVRVDGGSLVLEGDDGRSIVVGGVPAEEVDPDVHLTDDEAFRASAGSWKGIVDIDEVLGRLASERDSDRPAVVLDRA